MVKIVLDLDEKIHSKLWNQKEELSIFLGRSISWYEFFIDSHNKKIES